MLWWIYSWLYLPAIVAHQIFFADTCSQANLAIVSGWVAYYVLGWGLGLLVPSPSLCDPCVLPFPVSKYDFFFYWRQCLAHPYSILLQMHYFHCIYCNMHCYTALLQPLIECVYNYYNSTITIGTKTGIVQALIITRTVGRSWKQALLMCLPLNTYKQFQDACANRKEIMCGNVQHWLHAPTTYQLLFIW